MKSVIGAIGKAGRSSKGIKLDVEYRRDGTKSCTRCEYSKHTNTRYFCSAINESVSPGYICNKYKYQPKKVITESEKIERKKEWNKKKIIDQRNERSKIVALGQVDNPINHKCICIKCFKGTKEGVLYYFRDTKTINPSRLIYKGVRGIVVHLMSIKTDQFNKYFQVV